MKVITIGRSSQNDISINDPKVSRFHLQIIQHDDGRYTLSDFGSTNGTYVNGQRVYGEIILSPSDIIRIGNVTLPWNGYFDNYGITDANFFSDPMEPAYGDSVTSDKSGNHTTIIAISAIAVVAIILVFALVFLFSNNNPEPMPYRNENVISTREKQSQITSNEQFQETEKNRVEPNISGNWHWESDEVWNIGGEYEVLEVPAMQFSLVLKDDGETLSGDYCSLFAGDHMDGDGEYTINPVTGKWNGEQFDVDFRSEAWGGTGKAKIKIISSWKIEWTIVSSQGEIHAPVKATLVKQ